MVCDRKIMSRERGSLLITVAVFVSIVSVVVMGLVQNFLWIRRSIDARYSELKLNYLASSGVAVSRQYFSDLPIHSSTTLSKSYLYDHHKLMKHYDLKMDGDIHLCRGSAFIYIVVFTGHYRAAFRAQYVVEAGGDIVVSLPERL